MPHLGFIMYVYRRIGVFISECSLQLTLFLSKSITVSYKKNTQVLSWDTNDVESPIHPVAKITTRIRQIFDLNYPPRCYIVEKKRTQSSLVGCKWIPSQTYVIVENKEEIKDYKHKHKTTASSTTSASDKDSSVALTSDMDDLDI